MRAQFHLEYLMTVAKVIHEQLERTSWIRRMFEEGMRLKAERGAENIFDFTLGNPSEDPPAGVLATFRKLADANTPGSHGYMPNAGFPSAREKVAERLRRDTGIDFAANSVLMTVGCAGAPVCWFSGMTTREGRGMSWIIDAWVRLLLVGGWPPPRKVFFENMPSSWKKDRIWAFASSRTSPVKSIRFWTGW